MQSGIWVLKQKPKNSRWLPLLNPGWKTSVQSFYFTDEITQLEKILVNVIWAPEGMKKTKNKFKNSSNRNDLFL